MPSTYAFDLAKVGTDIYVGHTPHGMCFVQPSHTGSGFVAVLTDRKGKQTKLGTFDKIREAQGAAQVDAMIRNSKKGR